jgi:hypothetical protein
MMGFPEALSKTMTHLSGLAEETLPAAKIVEAIKDLLVCVDRGRQKEEEDRVVAVNVLGQQLGNMELDQQLASQQLAGQQLASQLLLKKPSLKQVRTAIEEAEFKAGKDSCLILSIRRYFI